MSSNAYLSLGSQSLVSELNISSIDGLTKNISTNLLATKNHIFDYVFHQYWKNEGCPNSLSYPLLGGGPIPVLIIMSAYLLFVTRIGPWFMKRRAAYELRLPMLVYNFLMVVINAYFFFKLIAQSDNGRVFFDFKFDNKYYNNPQALDITHTTYFYFLTKFVDLLDTVFFVLRKRDRQVSTLHLYHHTVVPILGWLTMKMMPTLPAFQLLGILNSLVHTIMYSYYALSAFGPSIQPYLWWKKYITQIQIIQFVILIIYSIILGKFQTGYPALWFWVGTVQGPLFFYMFVDFYIQSYRKSKVSHKSL